MKTLNDIRGAFLDYFESKDHKILPSSPLVPHNDPTLMFTNAGMVQFKDVFCGKETIDAKRAATSQKCVRAGGKHNDLDNVGYTARHHTFFEMLGNFSFGDYFKDGAIEYAWEFVTKVEGLNKDKLFLTVYHTDDEAFNLWKKISGFPDSRILRVPTKDNFWSMGDTGPCGPCSEIFYDHGVGEGKWALDSHGNDLFGERYVEIWNLVFMQYETLADGRQINLPKPSIDTGAGLERHAAVLQGVHDNYDTDLFKTIISTIKDFAASPHLTSPRMRGEEGGGHSQAPFRVIADHLRASCFLIADGVLPSNEGRGYVLRRIMRRAMRHAHILGCKEPLMYKLVPTLEGLMGNAYPELKRANALITETLRHEEERFKDTLGKGLGLLEEETGSLKSGGRLDGKVAFKLYDTYGFPLDLTQDILRGKGIEVDITGFNAAMDEQKKRARAAWSGSGEKATDEVWFDIREKHGATEFLGYESTDANGKIIAIIKDGKPVKSAKEGDHVAIVTNQTPFYGESGGQMGDHGKIISDNKSEIKITDTKKYFGALHVHIGQVVKGSINSEESVHLLVDVNRRDALRANHSATHLLHAALRKILGPHVTQKGSQVEAASFRFDFSHPKGLTDEEKTKVENEVNRIIQQKSDVSTRLMTPDEAIQQGAMALFGEKYGDEVRVLSMGIITPLPVGEGGRSAASAGEGSKNIYSKPSPGANAPPSPGGRGENAYFSVELCGGTHVKNTGDIKKFKITSEGSVASGVRRIEGVTRDKVDEFLKGMEQALKEKEQKRKEADAQAATAAASSDKIREAFKKSIAGAENIGGITFLGSVLDGFPGKDLRVLVDDFKAQVDNGVVAIVAINEGRASLVVGVTEKLTGKVNAVDLVKIGAEALGGKGGGGRPDLAQAGGPDGANAKTAINKIKGRIG